MNTHAYIPDEHYPWFCDQCGYPEHERLKHPPRDTDGSPEGGDPQGLHAEGTTAGAGTASPLTARMERITSSLSLSREEAAKVASLIEDEIERRESLPPEERT